ncbi:hypothetical protein N8I77_002148 [Diaporthe amygdali]|uniref:NACHT domain-containing protein n=1 Tax=Phomopsis amygdali TaxID=1214568 RepID=A0AAD9STB9_PHOAM|nr:hypothetical protein N8I77_002148 [Diaporthe amygdali]
MTGEKVSEIFLEVGRTAPRHAELACIYPGKGRLHSAMMEYSIVVVELCKSLFHPSRLQRFTTSLKTAITDPQLQKIKSSLATWSKEISEEVIVLQSRRLEETDRGPGIRSLISSISDSDRRRRRTRDRVNWLDACGDYDYERQRNLTRRSGNTEYFLHDPPYLKWRDWSGPTTLICEGKLGSGKSVLMANMVDDLLLHNINDTHTTAFFFVSDDTAGYNARTALGSLARQILESLPDSQWTDKLEEESRSLTTNRLTQILGRAVPSTRRIYLILDGFDEFPEVERQILVEQLKELQSWLQLRICISWRLEAKSRAREDFETFGQSATLKIPIINPDIEKFVNTEVDALLETGELLIKGDTIVHEIRQRLLEGANGMFLWVALQLQAICHEDENTIHEALENLPKSLPEVFHNILQRSGEPEKRYQMHILKTLVASFRPLTTSEFGKALNLASENATTPLRLQSRQVDDLRGTLSSCGSLVMIDEQDLTVHLVHQSVRQFLLGKMADTYDYREWQFSADTAHLHMAAVTMRYLSRWTDRMEVAQTPRRVQPSTTPRPSPIFLPNPVAIHLAAQTEIKPGKLSKILSIVSKARLNGAAAQVDVARVAESLWPETLKKTTTEEGEDNTSHVEAMEFLAYARGHWMLHSAPMSEENGELYSLWSQVLMTSDPTDWRAWDPLYMAKRHVEVPESMLWAVVNSHNVLLEKVLRKQKRRLKLLIDCLGVILGMSPMPRLSPLMAARFLTLQLFLQRSSMSKTQIFLNMNADFRYNNYACLYAAVFTRDYHATRAILCTIGDHTILKGLPYPLLELSVSCMDVHMTHLLLFHGVRPLPHSQVQETALALAISRLRPGCDPSSTLIAAWLLKSWASTDSCFRHHLARALITFKEMTNKRDFDAEQFIKVPSWGWLVHYVLRAVEKAVRWLSGLFTLKVLAMYAAVIAFLDSQTESRAMQVLTFVGFVLFGSVALCPALPGFGNSRQPPRAFPPRLRSVAAVRYHTAWPTPTKDGKPLFVTIEALEALRFGTHIGSTKWPKQAKDYKKIIVILILVPAFGTKARSWDAEEPRFTR